MLLVGLLVWLTKKRRRKWVVDAVKKAKKPSPKKVVEKKEPIQDESKASDEDRDKESDDDSAIDLRSTGEDEVLDAQPATADATEDNVDPQAEDAVIEATKDSDSLESDGEDTPLRDTDENPTVPTTE